MDEIIERALDAPGVDIAQHAMDQHPFPTSTRVLAASAIEALIRAGWKSPRMQRAAPFAVQGDTTSDKEAGMSV